MLATSAREIRRSPDPGIEAAGTGRRRQRSRSNGLQLTRVGIWYLSSLLVVAVAATNTGNNGLFLVTAMMISSLLVLQTISAWNVANLEIGLEAPEELFANRPARLSVVAHHRGRWWPRWLLVISIESDDVEPAMESARSRTRPWLVPHLQPGARASGAIELMLRHRGPRTLRRARVTSLFPLGLFRKGRRYEEEVEILVYPELFDSAQAQDRRSGQQGDDSARRPGWSHELYALRDYRSGDDPRGIHWKQTARQRRMIFQQRATDESQRLQIVFDNAVGELETEAERKRFERLVSEAATAAVDHLELGYEVALVTRDHLLPYATGARQRHLVLEALARIQALPRELGSLAATDSSRDHLRLAFDRRNLDQPLPGDTGTSASGGDSTTGGQPWSSADGENGAAGPEAHP